MSCREQGRNMGQIKSKIFYNKHSIHINHNKMITKLSLHAYILFGNQFILPETRTRKIYDIPILRPWLDVVF